MARPVKELLAGLADKLLGPSPKPSTLPPPPAFWPWAVQVHQAGVDERWDEVRHLLTALPTAAPTQACYQEAHGDEGHSKLLDDYYESVVAMLIESWQATVQLRRQLARRRRGETTEMQATVDQWIAYVDDLLPAADDLTPAPAPVASVSPAMRLYHRADQTAKAALAAHTEYLLTDARDQGQYDAAKEAQLRFARDDAVRRRKAAQERVMAEQQTVTGQSTLPPRDAEEDRSFWRDVLQDRIRSEEYALRAERDFQDLHTLELFRDGEKARFQQLDRPRIAAEYCAEQGGPSCTVCDTIHEHRRRNRAVKSIEAFLYPHKETTRTEAH